MLAMCFASGLVKPGQRRNLEFMETICMTCFADSSLTPGSSVVLEGNEEHAGLRPFPLLSVRERNANGLTIP